MCHERGTRQRLCLPCAAVGHTGNLNGRRWPSARGTADARIAHVTSLCSVAVLPRHKANSVVCYVPVAGTRQTLTTVARPDGRRTRHARAEDLPCAWKRHTTNITVCRVPPRGTRQSDSFAVCMILAVRFLCDARQCSFLPCAQ